MDDPTTTTKRRRQTATRRWLVVVLAALAPLAVIWFLTKPAAPNDEQRPAEERPAQPLVPMPANFDVLVVGGGADPASNQTSIAQDTSLAADTFRRLDLSTAVLFGAGAATPLQELQPSHNVIPPTLRDELAWLLGGHDHTVTYRFSDLPVSGGSLALLPTLGRWRHPARLLFLHGHGDRGEVPEDAYVHLWGGAGFTVPALRQAAEEGPLRVVLTTCFSGGFAEAFLPDKHELQSDRCGLFATTWDREASGCDPNPERGHQQGFAIHFYPALEGRDREGHDIDVDYDGDGRITLLEAHARARIAGASYDVPTTSSEYFLRVYGGELLETETDGDAQEVAPIDPEDQTVRQALQQELAVANEETLAARWADLEARIADAGATLDEDQHAFDQATRELQVQLLTQWPTLDDAWSEGHDALLRAQAAAIDAALHLSAEGRAYATWSARTTESAATYDTLQMEMARLMVLARVYENDALRNALWRHHLRNASENDPWTTYAALRDCERFSPASPHTARE